MRQLNAIFIFLISSNLAFGLSNLLVFGKFWMDGKAYPSLLIAVNLASLLAYFFTNQQKINATLQVPQLIYKQFEYLFVFVFFVLGYWFSVNSVHYCKESIVLFFVFAAAFNFLGIKLWVNYLRKFIKESPKTKAMIVGQGAFVNQMENEIRQNQWLGYDCVGVLPAFSDDFASFNDLLISQEIQVLFIEIDSVNKTDELEENLRHLLENHMIKCYAFSSLMSRNFSRGSYMLVGTIQAVPLFSYPLDSLFNKFIKRGFDILFSLALFLFLFSWLFPILMLLVILDSGFPVFFSQKRHGMDNKEFNCFKFRTMVINKESNSQITVKNDPRITRLGRILRKTSIDELPQFWNVLKGEMSVVGPRPHMVSQNNHYNQIIDKYLFRHYVKPGLTGLAQVKGYRGEIHTDKDMENRILEDIHYVRNWSFFLDLKIIIQTVIKTLKGDEKAI